MALGAMEVLGAGALGAACGVAGGLFGVGGGVIAIPILGIFYALHQQMAQGTVLVMVVPNVLLAFWQYRRRIGVETRMAVTIAAASLAATYPAARFATGLDPRNLRLAFAGFLVGLAILIAHRTWRGRLAAGHYRPYPWGAVLVGLVGGTVSGLFGVGGAFIAPPLLTGFFGLRQIEAQGLALAVVCPATIVALTAYSEAGQVDWSIGIPLAIGGTMAISAGVSLAQLLPERRLRLAFCGLLTVTGGLLALHA